MKNLRKYSIATIMMLAIVMSASLMVLAADNTITIPVPEAPAVDVSGLIQSIVTLLAAFVTGLISVVLNKIRQKYNIQVSAENEQWIRDQAEHAVQYVAEIAAKKAKITNGRAKISSNALLSSAISLVVANVPKLSREQASVYVHAALARIPGLGATGDCSYTVGASANGKSCVDAESIPAAT